MASLPTGKAPPNDRMEIYVPTKEAGEEWLDKMLRLKKRGALPPDPSLTLAEMLEYWLERVHRQQVRVGTYASTEANLRIHVLPSLGAKPAISIGVSDIQSCLDEMKTSGYARQTRWHVLTALRAALKWAEGEGHVWENVAKRARTPTTRVTNRNVRPLSLADSQAFLREADGTRLEALWWLFLTTGARSGEARGVRWSDFRAEASEISYEWTRTRAEWVALQ